jgi:hypothetical protein
VKSWYDFHLVQELISSPKPSDRFCGTPSLLLNRHLRIFPEGKASRNVKLSTIVHLLLRCTWSNSYSSHTPSCHSTELSTGTTKALFTTQILHAGFVQLCMSTIYFYTKFHMSSRSTVLVIAIKLSVKLLLFCSFTLQNVLPQQKIHRFWSTSDYTERQESTSRSVRIVPVSLVCLSVMFLFFYKTGQYEGWEEHSSTTFIRSFTETHLLIKTRRQREENNY